MTMKPCIVCGEPSNGTRCDEHPEPHTHGPHHGTNVEQGYGWAWDKLSRRARRMQPWCLDCGTDEDLTLDHLPSAWQRKEQGKQIRLGVDAEVVCRSCNSKRGAARGDKIRADRPGGSPRPWGDQGAPGEAKRPLHMRTVRNNGTPGGYIGQEGETP